MIWNGLSLVTKLSLCHCREKIFLSSSEKGVYKKKRAPVTGGDTGSPCSERI